MRYRWKMKGNSFQTFRVSAGTKGYWLGYLNPLRKRGPKPKDPVPFSRWIWLRDLRSDPLIRAEVQWRRHKAPMARYWKAVGVCAGHITRVIPK